MDVVAASCDDPAGARAMREQVGPPFPLGFGLPLHPTAARLGAFYEDRRQILHATGFVLRPGGTIGVACYSSSAIGRLDPDDVVRLVAFWEGQGA